MFDIEKIKSLSYTLIELKKIAKSCSLPTGGKKSIIAERIVRYVYLCQYATPIQRIFRGYLVRKYIQLHGPALRDRDKCINKADFFTLDNMEDISPFSFVSVVDEDGFIYGFEISSLYHLLYFTKEDQPTLNPYNRKRFSSSVLKKKLIQMYKIGRILNIDVHLNIIHDIRQKNMSTEERAHHLFGEMNHFHVYASPNWFLALSKDKLNTYFKKLQENWNFRLNLTNYIKQIIWKLHWNRFIYFY
jgi:hypothetical protein